MNHQHQHQTNILFDIDIIEWTSSSGSNNPSTHVSEPVEISCFSRDPNRQIAYASRHQLQTHSPPKLHTNLGDNFDTFVPKQESPQDGTTGVEKILTALLKSRFDLDSHADIVTYRNNLNKIGLTPYEDRDPWEIDCTQVANTVFLDIRKTPETPHPQQQLFTYYGYRFEALCTDSADQPVNANAEFCSVSRLRIANHRILLSSEIDCTLTNSQDKSVNPLTQYVELKTMKVVETKRALSSMYRHRFLKYWLQSYLAGVRHIFLGLRTEDGNLVGTKWKRTSELHREARQHFRSIGRGSCWDPFVCINFLDYVLATIRRACQSHPEATIRVFFDPNSKRIRAFRVEDPEEPLSHRIRQVIQEHKQDMTT